MRRSSVRTRGSTSSSNHTQSAASMRSKESHPEGEEGMGGGRQEVVQDSAHVHLLLKRYSLLRESMLLARGREDCLNTSYFCPFNAHIVGIWL